MSRVNEQGILLSNNTFLQAKNSSAAPTNVLKFNASNLLEFATEVVGVTPTSSSHLATKGYIDTNFILSSLLGANSGVATLDSGGHVPLSQIPTSIKSGLSFQGVIPATGALPSSPSAGQFWIIGTAGTFTGTSVALAVGDWIVFDNDSTSGDLATGWDYIHATGAVASVFGRIGVITAQSGDYTTAQVTEVTNLYYTQARFDTAFAAKSTTNLAEGTNLYFTTARAKAAAVANSITSGVTDVAPSQDAVFTALAAKAAAFTRTNQEFTLNGTDISNGYKDLAQVAIAGSVYVHAFGGVWQSPSTDFSVSLTGGSGGKTRVTFAGDLSAGLVSGNVIDVSYEY